MNLLMCDVLGRWCSSENSWIISLFVTLTTLLAVLLIYLFYKTLVFCITRCITRPLPKLKTDKYLEEIDYIYNLE